MLSITLKEETKDLHVALEKAMVPMIKGIQTTEDYVKVLGLFYSYYGGLENRLGKIVDIKIPDHHLRRKKEIIADDILSLGGTLPELTPGQHLPSLENKYQAFGALYVMEGSTLGGYSSHSKPSRVSVQGSITDTEVIYSIADNGIGIDIKQLPMVFELFKRMDNAKDIEGTGVGLAIVKRIVEKHQGKLWVDSELGKGSTFYLAFQR